MIIYLKRWLSIFIDYFKKQYGLYQTKERSIKPSDNTTNSIKFEIDEWNRFIITIRIENANTLSCEEFGKMLYLINDGRYDQKIVEVLVELGKNKQLPIDNVQQIMSGWTSLLATEMDENREPCIKPTQVFNTK